LDGYVFTNEEDIDSDIFQKFYEKHNGILVEDESWYNPELTWFKEILESLGFDVEDIRFSGFRNQGDGLSFKGIWNKSDMGDFKKFKNVVGANIQLLEYYDKFKNACTDAVHIDYDGSRYPHSGTMVSLNSVESDSVAEYVQEVVEIARELADEFYNILEEIYDQLTSKEEVLTWAIDNNIAISENDNMVI